MVSAVIWHAFMFSIVIGFELSTLIHEEDVSRTTGGTLAILE